MFLCRRLFSKSSKALRVSHHRRCTGKEEGKPVPACVLWPFGEPQVVLATRRNHGYAPTVASFSPLHPLDVAVSQESNSTFFLGEELLRFSCNSKHPAGPFTETPASAGTDRALCSPERSCQRWLRDSQENPAGWESYLFLCSLLHWAFLLLRGFWWREAEDTIQAGLNQLGLVGVTQRRLQGAGERVKGGHIECAKEDCSGECTWLGKGQDSQESASPPTQRSQRTTRLGGFDILQ